MKMLTKRSTTNTSGNQILEKRVNKNEKGIEQINKDVAALKDTVYMLMSQSMGGSMSPDLGLGGLPGMGDISGLDLPSKNM